MNDIVGARTLTPEEHKARDADLGPIFHLNQPNAPEVRFEWHSKSEKIFVIRHWRVPIIAENIAEDVTSDGQAQMTVILWLRGYLSHKAWAKDPDIIGDDTDVNSSHVIAAGLDKAH